ncbi:hypothetical protein IGB42_02624 [Andreprevotia sp. IGB-42]|uniref:hypothetical protein n=1 Tax=Andreprevotia sp. IGB-42 TaxID=2497473 RepID=UPI0013587D52|nr:hypothetical protein [Andreprevotia sp. IGB-42]KAF0812781.1 hypothetical protein IGB42_02624 [Andreprevotia sp. IGB-42]
MMGAATTWYKTGTIDLVNGSAAVVGHGTSWALQVLGGDILLVAGGMLEVNAVTADGAMTLASAYTGASASGLQYAIIRNFTGTLPADLAARWAEVTTKYQMTLDEMVEMLTSTAETITLTLLTGEQVQVKPLSRISAELATSLAQVQGWLTTIQSVNALRTEIIGYRDTAHTYADAASTSAAQALASKNAASTSESNASTSAAQALASKNAASTSESNASTSAAQALASKNAAGTSESNAATSATQALASKNAAGTSETNAATSAMQALASKNAAGTSETNAATSATQALASKNAAGTSETNAATSATQALASKNAAGTSETNASTSATQALASKNAAATSETNAAASAATALAAAESLHVVPDPISITPTLDANDVLQVLTEVIVPGQNRVTTYTYNGAGQLATEVEVYQGVTKTTTHTYSGVRWTGQTTVTT